MTAEVDAPAPVEHARPWTARALAWAQSDAGLAVLVFAGAVILLAARAPFARGQFWAEDGHIFYQQARNDGLAAFGNPYAGYFHFVPRVIGAVTAIGPVDSAPTVTWVLVAIVTGWCATTVVLTTRPWIRNPIARVTLALGVVLLPSLGLGSIAASCDLHFTMIFVALVALIGTARGRWQTANSAAFVLVTGLSTLLSVVVLPFALFRFVALTKDRRRDWVSFAWAAGVGVQLLMIAIARPSRTGSSAVSAGEVIERYAYRVVLRDVSPFGADDTSYHGVALVLTVAVVALIAAATVAAWRRGDRVRAMLLVGVPLGGFVYWVGSGLRLETPPRYEVFAALCLVWALLAAAEGAPARLRAGLTMGTCAALLVCWLVIWTPSAYREGGPTWTRSLSAAERTCARTDADSVRVRIIPRGWFVRLPCDDVVSR